MDLNINVNTIKDGVRYGFNAVVDKTSVWLGRAVAMIKSGCDTSLPYLQNKWIAAVSVFAVTTLFTGVGLLLAHYAKKCYPDDVKGKQVFDHASDIILGVGTVVGGVFAFSTYGKLPLRAITIAMISVFSICVSAQFVDRFTPAPNPTE